MPGNNFDNIPYAEWLESSLKSLVELPVKNICLCAILKGGDVFIDYHKVNMADKIKIAGMIQQDAMYDSLRAQGLIKTDE